MRHTLLLSYTLQRQRSASAGFAVQAEFIPWGTSLHRGYRHSVSTKPAVRQISNERSEAHARGKSKLRVQRATGRVIRASQCFEHRERLDECSDQVRALSTLSDWTSDPATDESSSHKAAEFTTLSKSGEQQAQPTAMAHRDHEGSAEAMGSKKIHSEDRAPRKLPQEL